MSGIMESREGALAFFRVVFRVILRVILRMVLRGIVFEEV